MRKVKSFYKSLHFLNWDMRFSFFLLVRFDPVVFFCPDCPLALRISRTMWMNTSSIFCRFFALTSNQRIPHSLARCWAAKKKQNQSFLFPSQNNHTITTLILCLWFSSFLFFFCFFFVCFFEMMYPLLVWLVAKSPNRLCYQREPLVDWVSLPSLFQYVDVWGQDLQTILYLWYYKLRENLHLFESTVKTINSWVPKKKQQKEMWNRLLDLSEQ